MDHKKSFKNNSALSMLLALILLDKQSSTVYQFKQKVKVTNNKINDNLTEQSPS
jgi:hypothetical protein